MNCCAILKSGKVCGNKSNRFVILEKNNDKYKISMSCEYHFSQYYNVSMERKIKI